MALCILFMSVNVTLRQLRVLLAAARVRSFTKTGEAVGLTQSAVSHSIRELESELGLRLFDRTTREVELSASGERLAAALGPLIDELDRVLLSAQSMAEQMKGKVRVATSPTISANLMPACISACSLQYPDIDLVLHDQVQALVLAGIRRGDVDFGVIVEPGIAPDLACEPIMTEPFCLVCPASHVLAGRPEVPWGSLADFPLVLLDHASGSRQLIDKALALHDVRYRVAQELGHATTVFQMVSAGIGVGVLPALAIPSSGLLDLAVRPLTPMTNRTIMLARRKHRSLSPLAETVWRLIAQVAQTRSGPA